MSNPSYVALSRAVAVRNSLDVVANNVANSNTTGFKKDEMLFSEVVMNARNAGQVDRTTSFTQDKITFIDEEAGALVQTGNALDLAIQNEGYFAYQLEDGGVGFGRAGSLMLDAEGTIVTHAGRPILDVGGGPIAVPEDSVGTLTIAADGAVSDANGNQIGQIGQFAVANIQGLQRIGGGMFRADDAPLVQVETPRIAQGFLEQSNVQSVKEVTRLINIQKAYTDATKLMENSDELTKNTLSRLGRRAG